MKSYLIKEYIPYEDKVRWLAKRSEGIGQSETASVLGLGYASPIEMFYRKLEPAKDIELYWRMFIGLELENKMREWLCYWDGTIDGMIRNKLAGNKIRKVHKVNAYITNPTYPWLFASVDSVITKGDKGVEGCAELKTISRYEANRWISNIPPSHIIQLNGQMLVCELTYGELAAMVEFSEFNVYPFTPNPTIIENIVKVTYGFWYNRVLPARKLKTMQYEAIQNHNMRLANECEAGIVDLEPELIGTDNEAAFLKEKFKNRDSQVGIIRGTALEFEEAVKLKAIREQMKVLDKDATLIENTFKNRIKEGVALDFGGDGKVSWSGQPRTFRNNIKNYK